MYTLNCISISNSISIQLANHKDIVYILAALTHSMAKEGGGGGADRATSGGRRLKQEGKGLVVI